MKRMKIIRQAVKFGIVGVINTLLTLVIIWLMTKKAGCSEAFSNFAGYFVGLINSFFLNHKWTFASKRTILGGAVRFVLVFAVCFLLQFGVLLYLNGTCPDNPPLYTFFMPVLSVFKIDPLFYIQMISMVVYMVLNFFVNKYYTFRK